MFKMTLFPHSKNTRTHLYFLLFLAVFGLSFYIQFAFLSPQSMWPDEALYGWYAKRIFADCSLIFSKEIVEFHPPLFACLLAAGHFFFPHELVYHLVPLAINMAGTYLIYLLGIKIRDQFTGLCASIILAFNFLYLNNSTRILIDNTLIVFIMLFVNVLLSAYDNSKGISLKQQIMIGITGSLVILLKWSGVLIIPFFILCTISCRYKPSLKDRVKEACIPLSILLITVTLLLFNNYFRLGHLLPDTSALAGKFRIQPVWYYFSKLTTILTPPFLPFLFVFGSFMIVKQKKQSISYWLFGF
ncbi:MAG: glycosyltransferase family 39 protein [Candidatus Omnitrophica bacterium]|nr:glycosyltransferase family 39 protein [Candidatus Omnitrophota bacterium]